MVAFERQALLPVLSMLAIKLRVRMLDRQSTIDFLYSSNMPTLAAVVEAIPDADWNSLNQKLTLL